MQIFSATTLPTKPGCSPTTTQKGVDGMEQYETTQPPQQYPIPSSSSVIDLISKPGKALHTWYSPLFDLLEGCSSFFLYSYDFLDSLLCISRPVQKAFQLLSLLRLIVRVPGPICDLALKEVWHENEVRDTEDISTTERVGVEGKDVIKGNETAFCIPIARHIYHC